jgi:hypothetical protein
MPPRLVRVGALLAASLVGRTFLSATSRRCLLRRLIVGAHGRAPAVRQAFLPVDLAVPHCAPIIRRCLFMLLPKPQAPKLKPRAIGAASLPTFPAFCTCGRRRHPGVNDKTLVLTGRGFRELASHFEAVFADVAKGADLHGAPVRASRLLIHQQQCDRKVAVARTTAAGDVGA